MDVPQCTCGTPAETNFSHLGPLCKTCFLDVLQRRARKALKDAGWLQPRQKVHFAFDETALGRAAEALFLAVIKGLPLDYVPAEQAEVIVVGKTADAEAEDFLHELFAGRLVEKRTVLNVLANISAAELEKYCEFMSITSTSLEKSALRKHLDTLEQRYPGTVFALQKSKESFTKE